MKKNLFLFMSMVALMSSCSSDDDAPVVEDPTLVKLLERTVTRTGPNYDNLLTTHWSYFGNRLVSASDSNGNYREYTYDNLDIISIKYFLASGTLLRTEFFVYNQDGKLTSSRIISASTGERHVYTHNDNNTISVQTFEGSAAEQLSTVSTGLIYLEDGEVVKTETFYDDGLVKTNIMTYDDMKKPTANIAGFTKISFAYATSRERKGNLHNMTSDLETYMSPDPVFVERTFTYDSEGYPLSVFNNSPNSFERYKMDFSYIMVEL